MQEAAAGALVEDGRVQALQDRGAAEALAGQQAQGVAGQARDGGGLRARTADVADGEAVRAVADREDVVEVAADFVAFAGRAVDDLDLDARDLGELRRQQAALEGLADGRALGVQAGVVEGEGGPAGEVLGELEDLLAEVVVGGLAEGQHADDAVAGDQGEHDRLAADRGGRGEGGADAGGDGRARSPGRVRAWRRAGRPAARLRPGAVHTRAPGVGTGSGGAILESRALRPSMRSSSSWST